jgi:hypothetical protein
VLGESAPPGAHRVHTYAHLGRDLGIGLPLDGRSTICARISSRYGVVCPRALQISTRRKEPVTRTGHATAATLTPVIDDQDGDQTGGRAR